MTMGLELNSIDVDCVIGERPDERTRLQRLIVDVALEVKAKAAETDELDDTVDYAELTERVRATLVSSKCKMIERAAKLVADECLADSRVIRARVRVTKSGAIAHLASATAVYEGIRS